MNCRLCSGATKPMFTLRVLDKYDVGYFECLECGSLMTEEPYWLAEAYAPKGVGYDTGAAQRELGNVLMMHAIFDLLEITKETKCVDIGSGTGLFARMMRDRGYDFTAQDAYTAPHYMDQFPMQTLSDAKIITAFEVAEHMRSPGVTFDSMFCGRPDYVFISTDVWAGQGSGWGYLNPLQGQHVFLYSFQAIKKIAEKEGYQLNLFGATTFSFAREKMLKNGEWLNLGNRAIRLFAAHMQNPWQHIAADNAMLLGKK